jgi:pimeloyl-ACP methyl ester carboxylesterase
MVSLIVAVLAIIAPAPDVQTPTQTAPPAARPVRPQEPTPPYPYREEQVTFVNAKAGITFAGTLTLPASSAASPAVVLITGSGAQDRDETVAGHKPFLVLADTLTRRGIAVLRVDDRGVGGSGGTMATATSEDFVDDALAAVAYLTARKDIDTRHIGLVGHSEGGLIAPIAATRSKDIAFIVLMAGPGITGDQILFLQGAAIMRANGASEAAISRNREVQEKLFDIIRTEKDDAAAREKIKAVAPGQERVATPWFRYFLSYDPVPVLQKVTCPVLAINGEKDLQVPYRENLDAIGKALRAGGNPDATTLSMPNLNHLFQTSQTGSPSEYAKIPETIAPVALDAISDWILKRSK